MSRVDHGSGNGDLPDAGPRTIGKAVEIDVTSGVQSISAPSPHKSGDRRLAKVAKPSLVQRCCGYFRLFLQVGGVGFMGMMFFFSLVDWPTKLVEDEFMRMQIMSSMFVCGLAIVALEDFLEINKSAIMLFLAACMWTVLAIGYHPNDSEDGAARLHHELEKGLQDVGSVVLFLLPAMGVVESIDHFDGFAIITLMIRKFMAGKRMRLMPIVCLLTFFLSSVIDNLTATIVALKILRHVVADDEEWRKECGGLVVMAANAGGAWSPIGDVTTTMLWIQGKITGQRIVTGLFFPSLAAGVLPLVGFCWQASRGGRLGRPATQAHSVSPGRKRSNSADDEDEEAALRPDDEEASCETVTPQKTMALVLGVSCVLMVPVLKMMTGLPPYMGMLFALGVMWLVTDSLGFKDPEQRREVATAEEEQDDLEMEKGHGGHAGDTGPHGPHGVVAALFKVDLTGLLFFTGVLLSVGALDSAGVLHSYARYLVDTFGDSPVALCTLLGLSSSIVDNVPLVEASIDMFRETPVDDPLWQLIALAAGTGGSILSIGSIAGVTLMSMEGVGFLWYCKRVSIWALLGFFAGIGAYQLQRAITG